MKNKRKPLNKNNYCSLDKESDENFSFIVGYTSNGFTYGVTWEEMNNLSHEFEYIKELSEDSEEIPF